MFDKLVEKDWDQKLDTIYIHIFLNPRLLLNVTIIRAAVVTGVEVVAVKVEVTMAVTVVVIVVAVTLV